MNKDYFISLTSYNVWANHKVSSWLLTITDTQWQQPVVSSFGNIAATVVHLAWAETIWYSRLTGYTMPAIPDVQKDSKENIINFWGNISGKIKLFAESINEERLQQTIEYKRNDGTTYSSKDYEVLAHVCNHASFHRGQLITMLRQAGFTDISSTDMSTFFRN